jgi:hypothetical protein
LYLFPANTLVQKLLSVTVLDTNQLNEDDSDEMLSIPLSHLTKVLGLLVNQSVTELDCTAFLSKVHNFNSFLLEHALKNCPKISKISLMNSGKLFNKKQNILPVAHFKKSWSNLTIIISHDNYICNEKALKLIQESFPNIESVIIDYERRSFANFLIHRHLDVAVTPLTKAGVGHLIKMKRLHTLDFVYAPDSCHRNHNPDFIVTVAGEVPSLRNFGFRADGHQNHFIQEFGKKYPRKQLLVDYLTYVPLS